jgi:2-C-methyl-D-erythritol 4-phosphate cytidylyltransferase
MASVTWGIVLAGGEGRRFGRPKQFQRVAGRRLVDYSVDMIRQVCNGLTLVLPDVAWEGPAVDAIAVRGTSRAASVRNGLAAVPQEADEIVIHDAAHPLATADLLRSVLARLREGFDAVAPIKPLTDPLKRVSGGEIVATVPREDVWITQSPAAFRAAAIRAAYDDGGESPEDLILIERRGGRIGTVPGDPWNVHVTTEQDLQVVRLLVQRHA